MPYKNPEVARAKSLERHERLKNDPEYRESRRKARLKYYHKNREKHRDYARQKLYGLTPEMIGCLKGSQRGLCYICNHERPLVVDHDHKTGRVRSLLCNNCNTALGMIGDNPVIAESLAKYLRFHRGLK